MKKYPTAPTLLNISRSLKDLDVIQKSLSYTQAMLYQNNKITDEQSNIVRHHINRLLNNWNNIVADSQK